MAPRHQYLYLKYGNRETREASKMPVFRKRVRDAFMVISVFSEWPESLGSLAVLCQKHYLASLPRAYFFQPCLSPYSG